MAGGLAYPRKKIPGIEGIGSIELKFKPKKKIRYYGAYFFFFIFFLLILSYIYSIKTYRIYINEHVKFFLKIYFNFFFEEDY